MSVRKSVELADLASVASTAAVDVSKLEDAQIFVGGTFSLTYHVHESADGTTFIVTQADKTAPGVYQLSSGTKEVKVSCSARVSGTIKSCVGGRDEQSSGQP